MEPDGVTDGSTDTPWSLDRVVPAAYWRRIVAQLLDSLVLAAPVVVVIANVGIEVDGGEIATDGRFRVAVALVTVIFVAYHTVLVATRSTTIGKAMLGLRVVRWEDGGTPSWERSFVRALVPQGAAAIPTVGWLLSTVCYGMVLFDPYRRGVHDLAGATVVVEMETASEAGA